MKIFTKKLFLLGIFIFLNSLLVNSVQFKYQSMRPLGDFSHFAESLFSDRAEDIAENDNLLKNYESSSSKSDVNSGK